MSNNELIARWFGAPKIATSYSISDYASPLPPHILKKLKFHSSWDWLMPVVQKISKLYEDAFPPNEETIALIMANKDPVDKHYIDIVSTSIATPIDEVYNEVVKFIKWHNEQKNEKG